jgi:hypothetical protein
MIRVAVVYLFLFAYGLGAGPIPWFFVPERFQAPIRAKAMSVIATVNWIFAFSLIKVCSRFPEQLTEWQAFVAFSAASIGGAIFGYYLIKNPDLQARKRQALHSLDELYRVDVLLRG